MAVHEEKYLEYCAAYVLGALDGEELLEFEAHLSSGCSVCGAEVTLLTQVVALLPVALPHPQLSPDIKERIMNAVRLSSKAKTQVKHRQEELSDQIYAQPSKFSWRTFGLAFVMLVMIAGFSLYINSLFTTINEQHNELVAQKTEITALKTEVERKEAILKVLESRRIDVVTMDGLKVNPVGYGKIIWDPDKKIAVLQVSHLPAVPKGKDYQLWVIKGNDPKPVSAGVFAVSSEDEINNYFKVQSLEIVDRKEISAFAITLEPKGGVPQPTGDMYLLGKTSTNE